MRIFSSLNRLLNAPDDIVAPAGDSPAFAPAASLLCGAVLCYVAYAVAAGSFQGGSGVLLAMLKVPLIILASVLLCLPSLYVFATLGGATFTKQSFMTAVAAFCAIAGLILLALMPITWLFSVSSTSLGFVVSIHVFVWLTAIAFGHRILTRSAPEARAAIGLWLTLLLLVSLQMTTYLRPVLWRPAGGDLFELEKKSFFMHIRQLDTKTPPLEAKR
ncbi:MAG TPA: hypothetical protein VFT12_00620 [Thermoanaerobaculia bacterium]|nr:hypothetical protein [Thermoanaerobaculia bacterium]